MVAEGALGIFRLGLDGFFWIMGVTVVFAGFIGLFTFRSWTRVGPDGITISWGFGRGRTHAWKDIRWVDVRETNSQYGRVLVARMTLANGRRRSLPALQHSSQYPSPEFHADFRRVVNWWHLNTDPAERFQPTAPLSSRMSPSLIGVILGLVIIVVVGVVQIGL